MARLEYQAPLAKIVGKIDFIDAGELYREVLHCLKDGAELQVDFSDVEHADSSALALMTCLTSEAKRLNKTLSFTGISDNLVTVASTCGLEDWIKTWTN